MRKNKFVRTFKVLLLLFAGVDMASAQIYENVYRPTKPAWQQLNTPHFRIIYQLGEEEAALQSAWLLEDQYNIVQSLVGGSLSEMPLVLNGQNDLSNGYVTTLHFRMEVEIPRIKSKSMNPSDGNWLNTVIPHELVHAMHLNVIPAFGISWVLRPFSPDLARAMHMAAPLGMIEGIAVFHESHRQYGLSGRGNHAYFTRQFETVYDSRHRWSLGQMTMNPVHTWPFDRHYIGGHQFIHWLQYEYGMETTKNTIRFVSRWPFLGYGSALWYHTGKRPSSLYRQFEKHKNSEGEKAQEVTRQLFEVYGSPSEITAQRIRRPFWINEHDILFYARTWDQSPGFYNFNTQSGEVTSFLETRSTDDYKFSQNSDRSRFLYSRYHSHPYYQNHQRMRIYESDTENMNTVRHVGRYSDMETGQNMLADRLHAPVYGPGETIWALRTHHERNILVSLHKIGLDTLLVPEQGHLLEVTFHPQHSDSLVLLANRKGLQGLWFLHANDLDRYNRVSADIAFTHGAIYDPTWHPDGQSLLFASDDDGRLNLYRFWPDGRSTSDKTSKGELYRLTNHKYGVMEPSWSPGGSRIAAVQLKESCFELVLLEHEDLSYTAIPSTNWSDPPFSGPSPDPLLPPGFAENKDNSEKESDSAYDVDAVNVSFLTLPDGWSMSPYQTGIRWLRPRSVIPFWDNQSQLIDHRFGATLSGGDVLRRHSYNAELSTSNNRFWYDTAYRFSGFYPGFQLELYRRPIQTSNFLLDRQGAGAALPFVYRIDQNTRSSSVSFVPGLDLLRERIITTGGKAQSDWFQRIRTSLFISWQHRLQQNIRDAQPNTGWLLFSEVNQDLQTDAIRRLSALRIGAYRFLSLRQKGNRSLRIGVEAITQNQPYFDISGFYATGFDESILSGFNNAARINSRYTIPLWYADRGQVLLPVFFDRFYLVLFSETMVPVTSGPYGEWIEDSRSLFGTGIRMQFRIFNFPLDIGFAGVYEPSRNRTAAFTGWF